MNKQVLVPDIGDFEKSKINLDKALKITPKFPRAYNFMGTLAEAQNDIKRALMAI